MVAEESQRSLRNQRSLQRVLIVEQKKKLSRKLSKNLLRVEVVEDHPEATGARQRVEVQ